MKEYVGGFVEWQSDIVKMLRRDPAGVLHTDEYTAKYCAWIHKRDVDQRVQSVLKREKRVGNLYTFASDGDYLRLDFRNRYRREEVCSLRGPFAAIEVLTYEGDLNPIRRLMADNDEWSVGKPLRAYIDIETDSSKRFVEARAGKARILSWAIVDDRGHKYKSVLSADTDTAETALVQSMWSVLDGSDQVVAWNGDAFDFPVIFERTKLLMGRDKPEFRRWQWLDHMLTFKRHNVGSAESGDEKQSMALDAVAHKYCGVGKLKLTDAQYADLESSLGRKVNRNKGLGGITKDLWDAGGKWREMLGDYNLLDTELLPQIEAQTGYIELQQVVCEVCTIFGDSRSLKPTVFADGFMLRLGRQRGQRFKTRHFNTDPDIDPEEQYAGAFVMAPQKSGITKNVHVVDFASLYPTIILSFNLSPETKLSTPVGKHCVVPANGKIFSTEKQGILPAALEMFMSRRKVWSNKQAECAPGTAEAKDAERRSKAYKVIANSFYGAMGCEFCRFYDVDVAESTTLTGKWLLEETMKRVTERGWFNLYGDTDSAFATGPDEDEFRAFKDWLNEEVYPKLLADAGCTSNWIKLEYEKEFERIVFPLNGKGETVKKRYIGVWKHYKGKRAAADSKPEVKGLEYKRGDSARLARNMQEEIVNLFAARNEDPVDFESIVKRYHDRVMFGFLDLEEHAISKGVKELSEYKIRIKKDGELYSQPPHIRVAKILLDRGEDVSEGSRISYVVTDAAAKPMTVIPVDDYTGEFDREYLWTKAVWPPTQRLLKAAFPDYDWSQWDHKRKRGKQLALFAA